VALQPLFQNFVASVTYLAAETPEITRKTPKITPLLAGNAPLGGGFAMLIAAFL
jgi:hypothetical protein